MRRWTLLVVAVSICLAACGGGGDDPPVAQAPQSADFPVTIENKLGSMEIPERPERVVALGITDADIAVALGITPLAVPKYPYGAGRDAPWLAERIDTGDVAEADGSEPSLEQIASLRPDVILASSFYAVDDFYAKLTEIAPVVTYEKSLTTDTWQTQTERVGRALGREAEADALVAEVEQQLADARAEHPAFEGASFSFSFHHAPDGLVTMTSPDDFAVALIGALGLKLSPEAQGLGSAGAEQLSFELLDKLDADALLMAYASDDLRRSLERNQVFRRVPAVRDDRYIALDMATTTALRNPSVLSIPYGVERLVPQLAGVMDR